MGFCFLVDDTVFLVCEEEASRGHDYLCFPGETFLQDPRAPQAREAETAESRQPGLVCGGGKLPGSSLQLAQSPS